MAGIFQPVHNEQQGGVPVQQPVQPGVTGGLTQTSGLFGNAINALTRDAGNYFKTSGSGGGGSVFDKKTAILRPIFKEIDKFSQLRGQKGVNFRPQFNKFIREAIAENPMLHSEISDYAIEASGIDVGGIELDPVEAAYQFFQEELKTPEGVGRALGSLTLDKDGNSDQGATIAKFQQLTLRDKQDQLLIADINRRVEIAEGEDKLANFGLGGLKREATRLELEASIQDSKQDIELHDAEREVKVETLKSQLADLKLKPAENQLAIARIEKELKDLSLSDKERAARESELDETLADNTLGGARRADEQAQLEFNKKKRQVAEGELSIKASEIARDAGALELLPRHRQRAQEAADGFINSLVTDPVSILAQQDALTKVEEQIAILRNQFSGEAGSASVESSAFYDVNKALAPLIALKDFYISQQDNMQIIARNLESRDKVLLGEVVRKATGLPIGAQREFIQIIANKAALGHRETIDELLKADSGAWSIRDHFSDDVDTGNVEDVTGETPVFSERLSKYVSELNEGEQKDMVSAMFTLSSNTDVESLALSDNRRDFTNKLAIGIASARAVSGETILSNSTLKALYNTDFASRFNKIVEKEDIYSSRLIKTVGSHIASVIVDREQRVQTKLEPLLDQGVFLNFKEGKVSLQFDVDDPRVPKSLWRAIATVGTDVSNVVKELSKNTGQAVDANLLGALAEVNELNRTLAITQPMNVLGEAIRNQLSNKYTWPEGKKRTVIVKNEEEFENAPSGSHIIWMKDDQKIPMGLKP